MFKEWCIQASLLIIGVCSGALVAAGMFAFVTMIGVVSRMAARTKSFSKVLLYEDLVVLGAAVGNILFLYEPNLTMPAMGALWRIVFGVFAGVYVVCLSIALAELLNVVPIFSRRIKLNRGLTAFVLTFAFGKLIGAVVDLFLK
ncbi:MAG: stage V sporulation protein AB [Lachnospiraceae bacterium]|nr:stage V sporulation protein AB [Lachnospiraceae bacterium]